MKTAMPAYLKIRGSSPRLRVGAIGLVVGIVLTAGAFVVGTPSASAAGGPVILGGDDLTEHGGRNTTTNANEDGWLYLQRAIQNVAPAVTRAGNDGSIAALGSADATSTGSGDAGAAIHYAAQDAGKTVTYHDGGPAIDAFFAALRAGTAKPAIIWIAGDGATNDLDATEATALANNATTIGDFVNSGGGLISHGVEYGWLSGLLPGASVVGPGADGDLQLTPQGSSAFPGLTNADVNAGPWHAYFEGNLGGLGVLVESTTIDNAAGANAPVIIGGAAVTLPGSITLEPPTAQKQVGGSHTVTATVRNSQGGLRQGATVNFSVTAGPNTGKTGTGTTDANGQTTFTYTDTGTGGTDTIQASFVDEASNTRSTTATVDWTTSAPTTTSTTVAGQPTTTTTVVSQPTTTIVTPCSTTQSAASVNPQATRPGGSVSVSDGCFAPNATLTQVFQSTPVVLGTIRADANGRYANTIVVPLSADPGLHQIITSGPNPAGSQHHSIGTVSVADLDCSQFTFREDAQAVLNANRADPHGLDPDRDGLACETLPSRVAGHLAVTGGSTNSQLLVAGLALILGSALVIAGRKPWVAVSAAATRLNHLIDEAERRYGDRP